MTRQQIPAAILWAVSCLLVVAGVALVAVSAAFITAGVLTAVWTSLFFVQVGDRR